MTHSTTCRARRTAVPILAALALVGTTAATSPASAAPAGATTSAARHTTDLGFVTHLSSTTLRFDRAVLLTGAAADAEQRRRGLDTTADAFVQNDRRRLRTRTVAPGVSVVGSQVLAGRPAASPVPLQRLRAHIDSRPKGQLGPLFRLTLDRRDRVVRIAEVYLP